MAEQTNEGGGFAGGFFAGAAVGLLIALMLGGTAAYLRIKKGGLDARRGWNLVPVLVAKRALPKGAVLTAEDLATRRIPEQFMTGSLLLPNQSGDALNVTTTSELESGEPIRWADLADGKPTSDKPAVNVQAYPSVE